MPAPLGSSSEAPVISPGPRIPRRRGLDGPTTGSAPPADRNSGSASTASAIVCVRSLPFLCQRSHLWQKKAQIAVEMGWQLNFTRAVHRLSFELIRGSATFRLSQGSVSQLFKDTNCVGIRRCQSQEFRAKQVIICCGAIHSPAMLLRAGIGPVGHFRDLGIELRASRPGSGSS
jgi:5-(hydroxymethyl)furfural/furfural oxidase